MASRTGLMPVQKSDRTHMLTVRATQSQKEKITKKTQSSVSKPAPRKSTSLLNSITKTQNTSKPRTSASSESVVKTTVATKMTRPGPTTDSNKTGIQKPETSRVALLKRKSHPGTVTSLNPIKIVTTPARKSSIIDRRTPKSILKKEFETESAKKVPNQHHNVCDSRHVKFRTKVSDQESLRSKLNSWLEAKGKTPSRCRHLICFDAEMSAKKKRDKLVDRTISQNLLSQQDKALENEEVRKQLFGGSQLKLESDKIIIGEEKENVKEETKEELHPSAGLDTADRTVKTEEPVGKLSPNGDVPPTDESIRDADIYANLKSMLDECLTLFYSGCPLDSILPWLEEMETHIPKAQSYTPFYICKAKVMAAFPPSVLEVYCQAVRNNAQPSDLLAEEMKATFSKWLIPPTPPAYDIPSSVISSYGQSPAYMNDVESSYDLGTNCSSPSSSHCSTPSRASDPKRRRLHSDGSVVKYSITTTTPLLRHTPEAAPLAVVTPVRRSNRLSNRQSTPGSALRREINSVSDLDSEERKSMLYRDNPALTGE